MCNTCSSAVVDAYRHKWEAPIVWCSIFMIACIVLCMASITLWYALDSDNEIWAEAAEVAEVILNWFWYVLILPFWIGIARLFKAAQLRSQSAKVGWQQFPEIWMIYEILSNNMGVTSPPPLYVYDGSGSSNAFALSCSSRRHYISISSELAHQVYQHPQIVEFVLAHELAHHKLGHTSLFRSVLLSIMNLLVFPGKALSRAQEFSADRLAAAYCMHAVDGMVTLSVGPWMASHLSTDAFYEQALSEEKSISIRIVNLFGTHTVLINRYRALRDIAQFGFQKHGNIF